MAKCPKCGEEITMLYCSELSTSIFEFTVDKDGFGDYDFREDLPILDGSRPQFDCPHCWETLATKEEDAIKILRGEPDGG